MYMCVCVSLILFIIDCNLVEVQFSEIGTTLKLKHRNETNVISLLYLPNRHAIYFSSL